VTRFAEGARDMALGQTTSVQGAALQGFCLLDLSHLAYAASDMALGQTRVTEVSQTLHRGLE
jgi:hypothetical protein